MAKYVYPAVFTPEKDGKYSVNFPNIAGCYTCGDTLADAIEMAEDILGLKLVDIEDSKEKIPESSKIYDVPYFHGEIVNLIAVDTVLYRKQVSKKAVKKTLTIPEWLNTMAENANMNFSQTLQDALMKKLGVTSP